MAGGGGAGGREGQELRSQRNGVAVPWTGPCNGGAGRPGSQRTSRENTMNPEKRASPGRAGGTGAQAGRGRKPTALASTHKAGIW